MVGTGSAAFLDPQQFKDSSCALVWPVITTRKKHAPRLAERGPAVYTGSGVSLCVHLVQQYDATAQCF